MSEEKKPDFTLSDGTAITFDLRKMTRRQWKGIFDPGESDEESDVTVARVCGIEIKKLLELDLIEYKTLLNALIARARQPLSDPNA